MGIFSSQDSESQGGREDREFNAGDLSAHNQAEADARADYEAQVGSAEHEQAIADTNAREAELWPGPEK